MKKVQNKEKIREKIKEKKSISHFCHCSDARLLLKTRRKPWTLMGNSLNNCPEKQACNQ